MRKRQPMTAGAALFAAAVAVSSAGLSPPAREVPLAVALPTLGLLLLQLFLDRSGKPGGGSTAPEATSPAAREGLLAGSIALFALTVWLFGFAVAIPLFVFFYARVVDGQRPLPAAGLAAATGITLAVIFGLFFDVAFFGGLVPRWVERLPW